MVFAHSFIGAPLTYLIVRKLNLSEKFKNFIYFIGITGAVLPDFDLILSFFIQDIEHRKLISHSVIPYLFLFLVVYLVSGFIKKHKVSLRLTNLVLFITILSHLIIDFFVGSIAIFAPFDPSLYGIKVPYIENFFYNYLTSHYVFYELILISSFFIFQKYEKKNMIFLLSYFYFFAALAMVFKYSLI